MTIEQLREMYNGAVRRRDTAAAAVDAAGADADLTAIEREFDEAQAEVERTHGNMEAARHREESLRNFQPVEVPGAPEARVEVHDPVEYCAANAHERSFFGDMYSMQAGDFQARERIGRHSRANAGTQQRDGGTSNYAGLVIPQYLVDEFAPLARSGRPTADACNGLPLPAEGTTFQISRVTTGSSAAEQTVENTAISETDINDTLLTVVVKTMAGQQDVSRQLLERGTPGIDRLIYQDLSMEYATKLNAAVLAAILATAGINTVTWTEAAPTVAKMWPKLSDGIQQIASKRFLPADTIVGHSRRYGWLTAALDGNGRPLIVPTISGPMNAAGVGGVTGTPGAIVQGLPFVQDAGVPSTQGAGTNEDVIIIGRHWDWLLWEEGDGTPRQVRFEQPGAGTLTIKLAAYGYYAFTAERYAKATSVVSGTGLVTPTF